MSKDRPKFELSGRIEHYLAVLSKLYVHDGARQKQEILVNSQIRVQEEWTYDNWNGGTHGHALFLTLPEPLYLRVLKQKDDLRNEIQKDLNNLHDVQDEFIAEVFFEMENVEDKDWRQQSGLLHSAECAVAPRATERIWGDGGFRIFLSHKAEVKKEVAALKSALGSFGATCFVAHEDIHPTAEWQNEIENALASMNAFVALLTKGFHDSLWTDQEVGFAIARKVPIIAVKLGLDPYGFIGKFQALSSDWEHAPVKIAKLLIKQPMMLEAFIKALPRCPSFEEGITISEVFSEIETLTPEQADEMMSCFNRNTDLRGSWGFNGKYPSRYGDGLAPLLSKVTGRKYMIRADGDMERRK